MVNVSGRSKGCVTCRRRKKGCDQQRPACGQCRKACIPCGGYQPREHKFIDMSSQRPGSPSQNPSESSRNTGEIVLPATLACSAYHSKCLELFWVMYLPRGTGDRGCKSILASGWFETVYSLCPSNQLLSKITLAIALNTIGRRNNDADMKIDGPKLYGEALTGVSLALRDPKGVKDDGLLAVIRLLSLYESMYGSDDHDISKQARSWQAHCIGDAALVKARAPAAYATGHAHRLFADGRLHLAIMALQERKKSPFSQNAWKTLPFSQHGKISRDYLIDILMDIPSLFENLDKLRKGDNATQNGKLKGQILSDYSRLEELLIAWKDEYGSGDAIMPDHLRRAELPQTITPDEFAATHLASLYWTTRVLLHGLVRDVLLSTTNDEGWRDLHGLNESEETDTSGACSKLIRTFPVFFHSDAGIYRVHLVTFPMSVVLYYLKSIQNHHISPYETAILAHCLERPECATIRRFVGSMHSRRI